MAKKIKEVKVEGIVEEPIAAAVAVENAEEVKAPKAKKAKKEKTAIVTTGVSKLKVVLGEENGAKIRGFLRNTFPGINGGKGKGYNFTDTQIVEIVDAWNCKKGAPKVVKAKKETGPEVQDETPAIKNEDVEEVDIGDIDNI